MDREDWKVPPGGTRQLSAGVFTATSQALTKERNELYVVLRDLCIALGREDMSPEEVGEISARAAELIKRTDWTK